MVVAARVPEEPTVTVLLNVELSVLTSNPAGGVTNTPAVKAVAETLKLVDDDAVPVVVVKAANVPLAVMVVDARLNSGLVAEK